MSRRQTYDVEDAIENDLSADDSAAAPSWPPQNFANDSQPWTPPAAGSSASGLAGLSGFKAPKVMADPAVEAARAEEESGLYSRAVDAAPEQAVPVNDGWHAPEAESAAEHDETDDRGASPAMTWHADSAEDHMPAAPVKDEAPQAAPAPSAYSAPKAPEAPAMSGPESSGPVTGMLDDILSQRNAPAEPASEPDAPMETYSGDDIGALLAGAAATAKPVPEPAARQTPSINSILEELRSAKSSAPAPAAGTPQPAAPPAPAPAAEAKPASDLDSVLNERLGLSSQLGAAMGGPASPNPAPQAFAPQTQTPQPREAVAAPATPPAREADKPASGGAPQATDFPLGSAPNAAAPVSQDDDLDGDDPNAAWLAEQSYQPPVDDDVFEDFEGEDASFETGDTPGMSARMSARLAGVTSGISTLRGVLQRRKAARAASGGKELLSADPDAGAFGDDAEGLSADAQALADSETQARHRSPAMGISGDTHAALSSERSMQAFDASLDSKPAGVPLGDYADPDGMPDSAESFFDEEDDADFMDEDILAAQEKAKRSGGGSAVGRNTLILGCGLLGALVVGGALAYAYKFSDSTAAASGQPPLIQPDSRPVKVAPDDAGGQDSPHKNKLIYDRLQGDRPREHTQLQPREEQVAPENAETAQVADQASAAQTQTPSAMEEPGAMSQPQAAAPAQAAENAPAVEAPRRVKTLVVRPDGTIVASEPDDAPAPEQQVASAEPQQPAQPQPQAAAQAKSSAQRVAAVEPEKSPEPEQAAPQASAADGKYAVQVSSRRSEEDALATFKTLKGKYSSQIGDYGPLVQKAELGSRGTWYRLQVGPMKTKAEAADVCAKLKSAGLPSCLVNTR